MYKVFKQSAVELLVPIIQCFAADLEHLRVVKNERHQKWAAEHGMTHHVVSAKTGESVSTNISFPS